VKKTPLYSLHVDLGARMVNFAGFEMPVSYSSITQEHMAVRKNAGLFDVSHMGEFFVEGPQALDFMQFVTTNDVCRLNFGQAQYSCFTNDQGGIVDDLLVYYLGDDRYMMVVNAGNIEKDLFHLRQYVHLFNVNLINASESWSLLALQGPKAKDILQKLTETDLFQIPYYNFDFGTVASHDDVIISNTGYTGEGGFELYCQNSQAVGIWKSLLEVGKEMDLLPCGLGSRDTLRLEKGYCLYGQDIDENTTPLEAGLGWIVKFSKDFPGKEILEYQKIHGIQKKLVGFVVQEKFIPRNGYIIQSFGGEVIGKVTSGTLSPILEKPIGLGYVKTDFAQFGNEIYIEIRNNLVKATVVKLPFV